MKLSRTFPRRKFLQLAAGAAALPGTTHIARAQAYPAKPLRWIVVIGDVTVGLAIDSVIAQARKAKIPVIGVLPEYVKRGMLFAGGSDFYQTGRQMGEIAIRILQGEDIAKLQWVFIGVGATVIGGLLLCPPRHVFFIVSLNTLSIAVLFVVWLYAGKPAYWGDSTTDT